MLALTQAPREAENALALEDTNLAQERIIVFHLSDSMAIPSPINLEATIHAVVPEHHVNAAPLGPPKTASL
jgi:hypothetical protein